MQAKTICLNEPCLKCDTCFEKVIKAIDQEQFEMNERNKRLWEMFYASKGNNERRENRRISQDGDILQGVPNMQRRATDKLPPRAMGNPVRDEFTTTDTIIKIPEDD